MKIVKRTTLDNNSESLAKELDINSDIAALLISRSINTADEARAFFAPSADQLTPSNNIYGMNSAVNRIKSAIANEEKILIYGDYDCDGILATSILKLYFQSIGVDALHYIPSRTDGYGLSIDSLEKIVEEYLPDLIITVDCGITAVEEVEHCNEVLGVEIIVTDHHEPQEVLPDCIIINPKLDDASSLKDLCGAGIAFKLVEGLSDLETALNYIDLAAIATIADIVPLRGENRIICALGLRELNKFKRLGIKLLVNGMGIDTVTSSDVGYRIAPRINAPYRMGSDSDITALFTSQEYFEVESIVNELNKQNSNRQLITNRIYSEAIEEIKKLRHEDMSIIILNNNNWDVGILGLVASKLAKEFYKPIILLNSKSEYYKGSARSITGINIFQCLSECSDLLEQFGGHSGAAGLTVNVGKLDAFIHKIDSYMKSVYPKNLFEQVFEYDIEITDKKTVNKEYFNQLNMFEPTGEGNPQPILLFGSNLAKLSRIGNTEHVKIKINSDTEAVAFNSLYLLNAEAGAEYVFIGNCNKRVYYNKDFININIFDSLVKDISNLNENALGYAEYLKTMFYGADKFNARIINNDCVTEEAEENNTLFVSYSAASAKKLLQKQKLSNIAVYIAKPLINNIGLLVFPECVDYSLFRKVIYLDAPLSTGYLAKMENQSPDTEFVCISNYGYKDIIIKADISCEAIAYTNEFLFNCSKIALLQGDMAMLYQTATKYGYNYNVFDFVTHFCILSDCGAIKRDNNFYTISIVKFERAQSRVINVLNKIRNKL